MGTPHRVQPAISAVIPALNEAANLPKLLSVLNSMPEVVEVIVVDGGSSDDTSAIAKGFGAWVVPCEQPNRGRQLNAGASVANGQILWFLHADAIPPKNAAKRIVAATLQCCRGTKPVVGGNFRLHFDQRRPASRFFELVARVQRAFGVYYGDSAIWVQREVWQQLGGFRDWPLFEDYDFARRLEVWSKTHRFRTLCLLPPVVASSRRFGSGTKGALRLFWRWTSLQLFYWCGLPPHELARRYARK